MAPPWTHVEGGCLPAWSTVSMVVRAAAVAPSRLPEVLLELRGRRIVVVQVHLGAELGHVQV